MLEMDATSRLAVCLACDVFKSVHHGVCQNPLPNYTSCGTLYGNADVLQTVVES